MVKFCYTYSDHTGLTYFSEKYCQKGGAVVTDKFNKLDAEKQESIINAALIEFAERGFKMPQPTKLSNKQELAKACYFIISILSKNSTIIY